MLMLIAQKNTFKFRQFLNNCNFKQFDYSALF